MTATEFMLTVIAICSVIQAGTAIYIFIMWRR